MVHWLTRSMAEMCGAVVGLYQRVPEPHRAESRGMVKVWLAPQSLGAHRLAGCFVS